MKPAITFVAGSLVPAIAIFALGGTPLACFVAGCLTAVIPALLFARKLGGWLCRLADGIDAVRGVSGIPARSSGALAGEGAGYLGAENPGRPLVGGISHAGTKPPAPALTVVRRGPPTHTTSADNTTPEANELETALINLQVPKKQAKSIAQKYGPGLEHFNEAVQMARG